MLEETYFKFKKNILLKMKKMQQNFQEPVVEYCEPDQVIDICSYNHYPVLDKSSQKQEQHNDDNDIYETSQLEHEFKYGIYEDVFQTEQLMAELKRIDEAEKETKKLRDVQFEDFPLEQFSDAGRVANEGDPQLKAAADTELYDLEKRAIQIDIDKHEYENSSDNTDDYSSQHADDDSSICADDNTSQRADDNTSQRADDNSSQSADDDILQTEVSHVQLPTVSKKYHVNHDDNTLQKLVYRPMYVPYNEYGQKLLLLQTTDMSRKDNLKLLYNTLPEGMCDNEYESLEQSVNDVETFQYSHETSTKHVLVQGVYVGSASPLIADIKTQSYSMLTYLDDGMMTGTYDNTHDIPIYIDNGSTLNIMPMHFYDNAYYLHHLPKAPTAAKTIHTGNGPVKTHFWIDILLNIQGCMIQFKLLVCDTQAQTGILLSKMVLEHLQTWQDYSTNTLYVKQTAIPLHAIQNIELLPERKTTIEVIADRMNELQYKDIIEGQAIVWVWSNDSLKPLQPIVATFHNDKTLITFENTTGQMQYISKAAKVAVLGMHSKDRAMTNFEWDIPTDDEGNLVLYTYTFASSLKPTKLANEDPVLQAETKIEVSQTPNKHTVQTDNTKDPYPWLDSDDPRHKMTDEEILHLKVPSDKSILSAAEKEWLIKLMLENTAAFSIKDEIGTCPYFEVKLKLRDDKPYFVRPYNICEDQKPIIQKEMDRLEKLGIILKGLTGYSSRVLLVKRK